jgi:ADP-ribosylglycohydrolase
MTGSQRISYAEKALLGVSIGDAFGESFFGETVMINQCIIERRMPASTWEFTDDTIMSIAVFEELEADGKIDQERLVKKICTNHDLSPERGYGATARKILREIAAGEPWQNVSPRVFDGQGSMGNGAAMRVCPIGAYYYDDLIRVKQLAIQSAEITHAHPEAICGAIAVATATSIATQNRLENKTILPNDFIDVVLNQLPDSDTKSGIYKAKKIPVHYRPETIVSMIGNGTRMTAQDTIPFVAWCAANHLNNFEEALWKAISVLGDRDTICAMVGGISIMSSGENHIPADWLKSVEPINSSIFRNKKN